MSPFRKIHLEIQRWVVALIIAGPLLFAGVGIVAVVTGSEDNQGICEAVQGLRNDLVDSLEEIKQGASARNPEQAAVIKAQYDTIIANVGDPTCP